MYFVEFRLTLGGQNSFKTYSNFPDLESITRRGVNRQNVVATLHEVLYNSTKEQSRCVPRCLHRNTDKTLKNSSY